MIAKNAKWLCIMKIKHKAKIDSDTRGPLLEYLAAQTSLSKIKIKKAIGAGGCWIARAHVKNAKLTRLRKIKYELAPGDRLEFYFDDNALSYDGPPPVPLHQKKDWALWYKPVNMLSGASRYGQVCAIDYLIKQITGKDTVNVINRLDREASGILAVGYTRKGTAQINALWRGSDVEKIYQLEVLGTVVQPHGEITFPIQGKVARTEYTVEKHRTDESGRESTLVEARIRTGRLHQIRQHFAKFGHPVLGDPRYGKSNGHVNGLQLVSTEVHLKCPFSKKQIDTILPATLRLW